ncbi:MAG: DEAD/DEAH box helicase [Oscillospiraceae bacterium]
MNRSLQGDVGSGKTVVAAAAAYWAARNGAQTALMAPTEILAEQHRSHIADAIGALGVRCVSFTGPAGREKRRVRLALAGGQVELAIGTHMHSCRRPRNFSAWAWSLPMSSIDLAWRNGRRCRKRGRGRICW